MKIDRCYCFDIMFKDISKEKSLKDVQKKYPCGKKCGLCTPYIKEMLKTGEVTFNRIIRET